MIDLENEVCVTSLQTLQSLFSRDSDAVSLYMFYTMCAKKQGTESIRATNGFCQNGLHWGKNRFFKAKRILEEMGLIEEVIRRDLNGLIQGHYIRVKYLWKAKESSVLVSHPVDQPDGGFQPTNALDNNNINALDKENKNASPIVPKGDVEKKVTEKDFEAFWKEYPLKKAKQAARRSFLKANVPFEKIMAALAAQKRERAGIEVQNRDREKRGERAVFLPEWKYPATWLNQGCWEDEVSVAATSPSSSGPPRKGMRNVEGHYFDEEQYQGLCREGKIWADQQGQMHYSP